MDSTSFAPGNNSINNFVPPPTPQYSLPEHKHFLNKKFAITFIILALLGAGAYAGIWYWQKQQLAQEVVPTFTPRPTDPTSDWKTYTNTQYGFSFQYPSNINGNSTGNEFAGSVGGNSINLDVKVINTKDARFSGKNFQVIEGTKANNQADEYMYVLLDKFPGKEIEFFAEFPYVDLRQIVPTFKFTDSTGSSQAGSVDTSTWKTYTNMQYGFEVKYPADWNYRERSDGAVGFDSRNTAQLDPDVTSYKISIFTAPNLKSVLVENWLKTYYQGIAITDQKRLTVGGWSAVQTAQAPTIGYPVMETHVLHNSVVYIVRLSNEDISIYNQILSTFKFTK